jgi:hypothetical protein
MICRTASGVKHPVPICRFLASSSLASERSIVAAEVGFFAIGVPDWHTKKHKKIK